MLRNLYKLYIKLNNTFYKNKMISWGKKNLKKSIFFLSFDVETQRDVEILSKLVKKITEFNIIPYLAVPGELIEKNQKLFSKLCKSSILINHGYKIHTKFDQVKKKNVSTFSYSNISDKEIFNDLKRGHNSIKKITNQRPKIFRLPHFGEFSNLKDINSIYKFMKNLGYKISSSTTSIDLLINNGSIYKLNNILEIPINSCISNPLQILDSWAFISCDKPLGEDKLIKNLLEYEILMKEKNILLNLYFDPIDIIDSEKFFKVVKSLSFWSKKIDIKNLLFRI